MNEPIENTENFKIRNIMSELSNLFTDAIEEVNDILCYNSFQYIDINFLM